MFIFENWTLPDLTHSGIARKMVLKAIMIKQWESPSAKVPPSLVPIFDPFQSSRIQTRKFPQFPPRLYEDIIEVIVVASVTAFRGCVHSNCCVQSEVLCTGAPSSGRCAINCTVCTTLHTCRVQCTVYTALHCMRRVRPSKKDVFCADRILPI